MIFQKILKGIVGIDQAAAQQRLDGAGIACNWWRAIDPLPFGEISGRLTEQNIFWHLSNYDQVDPATGLPFGERTPFISATAGAVERDAYLAMNYVHSAFVTALAFATDNFQREGAVFYGYVCVLGKKALPHQEFAEETRDLNLFHAYQPFHPEGEVVAKIVIPSARLEKVEGYNGTAALRDWSAGRWPRPTWRVNNSNYARPEDYSNVREAIV